MDAETGQPAGQVTGHECTWEVRNVQAQPVVFPGLQQTYTVVLLICRICHLPETVLLTGRWELEQLR